MLCTDKPKGGERVVAGCCSKKFKVVVTDHPFPTKEIEIEMLSKVGAEPLFLKDDSEAAIIEAATDADAVMVTYAQITKNVIASLTKCRVIARIGIGVDNIDIREATLKGIKVTNVPDYCIDEVSDHAIALLLAAVRKIPQISNHVKEGNWDFDEFLPIPRLRGKILGIIGFGKVGRSTAKKGQALGLRVLAYDPYATGKNGEADEIVPLEKLLKESDFISIHCPLTVGTEKMINAQTLALVKPTAFLTNTARGGIIDEKDLFDALVQGRLAGAGLDVVGDEKGQSRNLISLPNVICTPHSAYYSEEATKELQVRATEEVVRALKGEAQRCLVNPEVLCRK
jgi:D-3-phosphoglycerate dehydrogenase